MSNNFNPLLSYSKRLQSILVKASRQKSPALFLYRTDARTLIFMLEALTRLFDKSFEEKIFKKWNKRFKKLEDVLGQIDYFVAFEKEFSSNKKISKKIIRPLNSEVKTLTKKFNSYLLNKKWLVDRLLSFDKKMLEYPLYYDHKFATQIKKNLEGEINKILSFCEKAGFSFTNLEDDVHELRRALRWISIYATALNGLIQLKKSTKKPKYNINYLTKDILNSPFNKLAAKPKGCSILEFDSNSFYALSFLIKELGRLKDKGLRTHALSQAIVTSEKLSPLQAKTKALKILGLEKNSETEILKAASDLMYTALIKDRVLQGLIVDQKSA